MAQEVKASEVKSFFDIINAQEEKHRYTVIMELLNYGKNNNSNLEALTEYPNFNYTKFMTKLATYTDAVSQTLNLDDGIRVENNMVVYHPELDERTEHNRQVSTMCIEFMKKNMSHKRRRSHEIVNALRGDPVDTNVLEHEHKGMRRFLGLR